MITLYATDKNGLLPYKHAIWSFGCKFLLHITSQEFKVKWLLRSVKTVSCQYIAKHGHCYTDTDACSQCYNKKYCVLSFLNSNQLIKPIQAIVWHRTTADYTKNDLSLRKIKKHLEVMVELKYSCNIFCTSKQFISFLV